MLIYYDNITILFRCYSIVIVCQIVLIFQLFCLDIGNNSLCCNYNHILLFVLNDFDNQICFRSYNTLICLGDKGCMMMIYRKLNNRLILTI